VHKEELIKFWKSSTFRSESRNFLKDSSTLWDRALFHNLAYISGESKIFTTDVSLDKESPLNFGRYPGPKCESRSAVYILIWTPDPDHILLDGALSFTYLLCRRHLLPFAENRTLCHRCLSSVIHTSYSLINLLPSPYHYIFNSPSSLSSNLSSTDMSFSRHFIPCQQQTWPNLCSNLVTSIVRNE